jgi:uncharacterized OB-fold protein
VIRVIAPSVDADDRFFWDGVARGELLVQRCADCGVRRHPPQPMCGACGSLEWQPEPVSGRGTVFSWIVSRHPSEPTAEPRLVAVVALEDGLRLVSDLVDVDAADVRNDMAVELVFREYDGVVLPQFRPVAGGAS